MGRTLRGAGGRSALLLALGSLLLDRCMPPSGYGAMGGAGYGYPAPMAPTPTGAWVPVAPSLPRADGAAQESLSLPSEPAAEAAVAALRELPAVRACLAREGAAGRRVAMRWVVSGGAVEHARAVVTPDDAPLAACLEGAVTGPGRFASEMQRRVLHGLLVGERAAGGDGGAAGDAAADAGAPVDAVPAAIQSHLGEVSACVAMLVPREGEQKRVTLRMVVGRGGEVVHAMHDPIDAPWRATARCVARAAMAWRLPVRGDAEWITVHYLFDLAGRPPALAPLAAPPMAPVGREEFTLENGLRVTVAPLAGTSAVTTLVRYRVGHRNDPDGYRGLAHFTEHMTFHGGRHAPQGVIHLLEDVGVDAFNGVTSNDATVYYAVGSPAALERMLWVERERMGFTLDRTRDDAVARELPALIEEHRGRMASRAVSRLRGFIDAALFPAGHPLRDTEERMGDLEAVRARDVQWFFQRWYRPDNAHLVVAGAVDPAVVRAVVTRYFSDVPARGARPPRWRAAPLAITAARTLRVQAGVGRPSLRVIWSAPGGCDPQAADLDLVASLLTRRLRVALVDAGLAFEVSAELGDDLDDARFQVTVVGVPEHPAEAMLERLDAVLRDVAARGFEPAELERVRRAWLHDDADTRWNPLAVADAVARCPDGDDPGAFQSRHARFDGFDNDRARAAAQRWLPLDRRLAVMVVPNRAAPREGAWPALTEGSP